MGAPLRFPWDASRSNEAGRLDWARAELVISVGAASANAQARTRKDTLIEVMDGNASKWMDDIGALDTPQGIPGISSPLRRKMSAIVTELPIMATVRLAQDRET